MCVLRNKSENVKCNEYICITIIAGPQDLLLITGKCCNRLWFGQTPAESLQSRVKGGIKRCRPLTTWTWMDNRLLGGVHSTTYQRKDGFCQATSMHPSAPRPSVSSRRVSGWLVVIGGGGNQMCVPSNTTQPCILSIANQFYELSNANQSCAPINTDQSYAATASNQRWSNHTHRNDLHQCYF